MLNGPFPHPASTAVPPGQDFDSPAPATHSLKVRVASIPSTCAASKGSPSLSEPKADYTIQKMLEMGGPEDEEAA